MNINIEKSLLIEQIKLVDDEGLITTLKELLNYNLHKQSENETVPYAHKQIIRERAQDYDSQKLITKDQSNKELKEKYGL
jgi:hypothetical protein